MSEKIRKNFTKEVINEVFKEQGEACGNCSLPLNYKFEAHHRDADCSNNSKENCELLCERCHDSKAYETLQLQKRKALEQTQSIIDTAIQGKLAGTIIDKLIDAIKLELSLSQQVNSDPAYDIPIESKLRNDMIVNEMKQESFNAGYLLGLTKNLAYTKDVYGVKSA